MKRSRLLFSLLGFCLVFFACKKEFSTEGGATPSVGTLQSDVTGECLPKTVVGTYEVGVALDGTANYIEVEVNVTTPGGYTISSDTVNGISFKGVGTFADPGTTTIKLAGVGTPFASGSQHLVITYGTSQCIVTVVTLPAGGAGPAVFTLTGAPGNCGSADVQGVYQAGVALNSSNQVILQVDVQTEGTYSVTTTTSNGISFSATGTFADQGPQTITLTGTGTPVAAGGSTNIPVTAGATTCSFPLTVVGPADYTIDCGSAIINGEYEVGTALTSANTVALTVSVINPGAYNITATINGMTFAASGNFAGSGGGQPVTLLATGTPTTVGTNAVPLTAGTAPCSFDVEVTSAGVATGSWQFTAGGNTFTGDVVDAGTDGTSVPGLLIFGFIGEDAAGETIDLEVGDTDGSIAPGDVYSCNTLVGSLGVFYFDSGTGDPIYAADPTMTTNTVVITIDTHNTTTKTITGHFSGKALNATNQLVDITAGTFTVTYP